MALVIGDRVNFYKDRFWWDVVGVNENFVILTRTATFSKREEHKIFYTIIDWRNGWRGPQTSWGLGIRYKSRFKDAEKMLRALEGDFKRPIISKPELSMRHSIELDIKTIERDGQRVPYVYADPNTILGVVAPDVLTIYPDLSYSK